MPNNTHRVNWKGRRDDNSNGTSPELLTSYRLRVDNTEIEVMQLVVPRQ